MTFRKLIISSALIVLLSGCQYVPHARMMEPSQQNTTIYEETTPPPAARTASTPTSPQAEESAILPAPTKRYSPTPEIYRHETESYNSTHATTEKKTEKPVPVTEIRNKNDYECSAINTLPGGGRWSAIAAVSNDAMLAALNKCRGHSQIPRGCKPVKCDKL